MTDMEEERMIEQAKAGDPKAQFEMSQWARQMSILEPNEERWNRLAAKCLVDAAQAGYEPAKRMVQDLISGTQSDSDAPAPEAPAAEPYAPASAEATERYVPETKRFSAGAAPVRPAPARDFYDQADEEDYYDGSEPVDEVDAPEKEGFLATLKKIGEVLKKGGLLAAASIGGLIAGEVSFNFFTVVAIAIIALTIYLLFRPNKYEGVNEVKFDEKKAVASK